MVDSTFLDLLFSNKKCKRKSKQKAITKKKDKKIGKNKTTSKTLVSLWQSKATREKVRKSFAANFSGYIAAFLSFLLQV